MSGVYKSLKVMVQDTLQRGKTQSLPLARVKGGSALSLTDEVEELERILAERIGRLKAALKEGEALVVDEVRRAEQVIENLEVDVAELEAKVKEREDTLRRKDAARQKVEETLSAKIHDLENEVKKKEEVLESRGSEVNALKSNLDAQIKQVAESRLAAEKAKAEAAGHLQRAEQLTEGSQAKTAQIEAQLRDTEKIVRKKESAIKGLEQDLVTQIGNFENLVRNKEELLAGRDAEINDLKSQLKLLTKGIEEMSSFFRQAEALTGIERKDVSAAVLTGPSKPIVPDASQEIVSPELLRRITAEFAEVAGVMEPIGLIIVRDYVGALGESMVKFPKTRLPELLESLCKELLDEKLKVRFRNRVAQNTQMLER